MRNKHWMRRREIVVGFERKLRKMLLKCIRSGEQMRKKLEDEMDDQNSSDSLATRDYSASASGYSSRPGAEVEAKVDTSNIEEAESSLRESGYLNYEAKRNRVLRPKALLKNRPHIPRSRLLNEEAKKQLLENNTEQEARALLGRLEYQKGNIEAALHVFEGIDIAVVTPKMKLSISRRGEQNRRRSQSDAAPPMSMHAVSLLLEAVFLKSKSLQGLGRYEEAAQSCKIILDTVESALPEGLPENFTSDCKLQETLAKAVELQPELWKLAGALPEAILSYRRALLYKWNLDVETTAKLQKEFAVFLLYSGCDASPPNLRSQMDGSFVPRNNLEEAILLLLVLLRKVVLGRIEWDPSVINHLSYALCVSGELRALAHQVEELVPTTMERRETYFILALCYYAEGKDSVALNLLKNILNDRESKDCTLELLLAAKICGENSICIEEGIGFCCKALSTFNGKCNQMVSISNCLHGVLLSAKSRSAASDSERIWKQSEALQALETSERTTRETNQYIVYHLCLEHAEQRKLDSALYYAKQLLRLEAGSTVKGYTILARILSAQKRFADAENVINAAIEQTGKWDHGGLLRTKAKLQIAQDQLKNAIETYTHLLAVIQVQTKSVGAEKRLLKNRKKLDRSLEMETWHDLAKLYTSLSQWRDAEICLTKSQAINPHSASRWHCAEYLFHLKSHVEELKNLVILLGLLNEAKGLHQEALKSFRKALDVDPTHVPSLISTACILRQLGSESLPVVRSFLMDALRIDRTNPSAWYNLGLLYKADLAASATEAAECFEAAAILEESAPIEPFR